MSVRASQGEISIWIGRLSKSRPPSPMRVGIIQSIEGFHRTKYGGRKPPCFSCLAAWDGTAHLLPSDWIYHQLSGSQTCGFRLNHTTSFPRSPVHRQSDHRTPRPLQLHELIYQSLSLREIGFIYICMFCFCEEHRLMQMAPGRRA